jgi:hypothetical protein
LLQYCLINKKLIICEFISTITTPVFLK